MLVPYYTADGVVRASDPTLRLELDIGHESELRAADNTVVSQLILHLSKENTSRVHVWLRENATIRQHLYLTAKMRCNRSLSFTLRGVFASVQQFQYSGPLHQAGSRVAKELAAGLQGAVDAYVVVRDHVEVARLRRVVRCLLRDVEGSRLVRQVPITSEYLAEDRIQRFLDSSTRRSADGASVRSIGAAHGGRICQPLR